MGTLKERIDADLKGAMKSKDELLTSVLRMLKSAIQVVATLIKQRRDSSEQFRAGERPELADKEDREITLLQAYLPSQLSPEQLAVAVKAAIAATSAKGPKDMGAVMRALMPTVQGKAEGRAISDEVKAQLARLT
jgi:uncharacterized protein YqeY